jgi:hypothetical protein
MAVEQSIAILHRVRRQYVQAKLGLHALQALAAVLVGGVILYKWQLDFPVLTLAAVTILISAVLYFILRWKSVSKTTLQHVARHLNRQYLQLEDSTELLLLHEPENLLQKLQQQRVSTTLQQLHPEKDKIFKIRSTATYTLLGLGLLLSAGILYLPATPLTTPQPKV